MSLRFLIAGSYTYWYCITIVETNQNVDSVLEGWTYMLELNFALILLLIVYEFLPTCS